MYDLRFTEFVSVCMIPDEESVTLKAFKSRLRSRLWVLGLQLDGLVDNLMLLCTRQPRSMECFHGEILVEYTGN